MTATDEATSKIRRYEKSLMIGSAVYCRLDKRGRVRIPAGFLKRGMLKAGLIRFGWKQDILMVFPNPFWLETGHSDGFSFGDFGVIFRIVIPGFH